MIHRPTPEGTPSEPPRTGEGQSQKEHLSCSEIIRQCREQAALALSGIAGTGLGYALASLVPPIAVDVGIVMSRHALFAVHLSAETHRRIQKILPVWSEKRKNSFPIATWLGVGTGCIAKCIEQGDGKMVTSTAIAMVMSSAIAALMEWGQRVAKVEEEKRKNARGRRER